MLVMHLKESAKELLRFEEEEGRKAVWCEESKILFKNKSV